jgi:ABC-type transporter Mla MlaB component
MGVDSWGPAACAGAELVSQPELLQNELPLLRIEILGDISGGCLARMSGHLVRDTVAALWSIEPTMANEARVVLDLSGVVAIDSAGLEATVQLMDAIRSFGGSLRVGREQLSVDCVAESNMHFS